jgi:hypothetical protein
VLSGYHNDCRQIVNTPGFDAPVGRHAVEANVGVNSLFCEATDLALYVREETWDKSDWTRYIVGAYACTEFQDEAFE